MEKIKKEETNNEEKAHEHDHEHHHHGKMPIYLYFTGLVLAIFAWFLSKSYPLLANILFSLATLSAGYHVVILEGIGATIERTKRNHKFTPNSHLLMGLAALGASLIGSFGEGTLLILIFSGAHFLEEYAEGRSKREITKLMEMNPTTARRIGEDGEVEIVQVEDLKVGDELQVLNGDQIPIDGVILSGSSSIDESSISGESIPREKSEGEEVYGSTTNGSGSFTMKVTKENKDTVFSKILELVNQNQDNQTKVAGIIQKFMPLYVKIVLAGTALIMLLGPVLFNWSWSEGFYRGLVILVAASPCALAAATVSVSLSSTSNLAKKGVLSKGSAYLSQFADIEAIAFDKTGTLTKGKPELTNYHFSEGVDEKQAINIIVALESESNHPLADAILSKFEAENQLKIDVENQIGRGLEGSYQGDSYRIGKTSSFENVPEAYHTLNQEWADEGKTVVFFAKNEEVIGVLALMDLASEDAKATIDYFKNQGIHTTLITGDSETTGQAIGQELGIDEVIANVLPEDKSNLIDKQKEQYGLTAMVGDGVNDAPALVNADVGVAMGEGTDVAVEVSDLVLMKNELSKLVKTHKTSRKMKKVIWQNIFFSMGVVAILVIMSSLGLTNIAISVVLHEGSTIVVILNGLRLLRS